MVLLLEQLKQGTEKTKLQRLFQGQQGKVGDIILVQYENKLGYWKMRQFIGRCISIRSGKNGLRYELRNIVNGTGISFSFDATSHIFLAARVVNEKTSPRFRQSKLYYLEQTKLRYTRLEKLA